jgi:hypothetical protein
MKSVIVQLTGTGLRTVNKARPHRRFRAVNIRLAPLSGHFS